MKSLRVFSPAKINLFLKVVKKRPDGYHELETIFERVETGDELLIRPRPKGIRLTVEGRALPSGSANLVYRAAAVLTARFKIPGVAMVLRKRLPVASGLGGGSGNAASTLLGMNRLFELGLSEAQLCSIAAALGSDVPFFVQETGFALGRGRGERLKRLDSSLKLWHVLVTPRLKVLTPKVYGRVGELKLTGWGPNARIGVLSVQKSDVHGVADALFNTLEAVVEPDHPVITRIKRDLRGAGALGAVMSGSGPTVFGIFESKEEARSAVRKMSFRHPSKWVALAPTFHGKVCPAN